jgi:hypothetical protein
MERETGSADVAGTVGADQPQPAGNAGVDLRRHRRRDEVETILLRAEHLPPADRALLLAVFQAGQTAIQVAALRGQPAKIVRREVRRLVARVLTPEFLHVVQRRSRWSRARQQVGQVCFVERLSLREASRRLALSMYAVRRHCEWIRAGAAEADAREPVAMRASA